MTSDKAESQRSLHNRSCLQEGLQLPSLNPGDTIELIAPASRCSDILLNSIKALLSFWQLNCLVDEHIFGDDLLCANTDEMRFKSLKNALENPKTKAVICARGGYGSMRLIPKLAQIEVPPKPKLFVGMSDITALNLFLERQWQWPSLHGALALDKFSPESIQSLKSILFGAIQEKKLFGKPLNVLAQSKHCIETTLTGGNLCLVQTSIGTVWEVEAKKKILFLEDVSERGYRIDRMLEHLHQANIFKDAAAILLGDFTDGIEPDGSSLVQPVLERFAKQCQIPVVQIEGIGHGKNSFPLPLGIRSKLQFGSTVELSWGL